MSLQVIDLSETTPLIARRATDPGSHYIHPSSKAREQMSLGHKLNPYYPFNSELQYLLAKDLFTPTLHPQNDIERVAVHGKYVKGEARFLSL